MARRGGDRHARPHLGRGRRAGGERGRLDLRAGRPGPADRRAGQRPGRRPGGRGAGPARGEHHRPGARRGDRRGRLALRPRRVPVDADRPRGGAAAGRGCPGRRLARPAVDRLHLPAYSLAGEPIRGAALAAAARRAPAERRPVVHGRAARPRRRPVPGPARRAAAGDRVRHRGGGGAHRGSARIRPGGEARPARCARRGRCSTRRGPPAPVDPTGAGDAFAAGYLLGGVSLGLDAAARAVATMGAMP